MHAKPLSRNFRTRLIHQCNHKTVTQVYHMSLPGRPLYMPNTNSVSFMFLFCAISFIYSLVCFTDAENFQFHL